MTSDGDHVTSQSGRVTPDEDHVTSHVTLEDDSSGSSGHRMVRDLHWLVGRMNTLARYEAGKHPKETLKVYTQFGEYLEIILQWNL